MDFVPLLLQTVEKAVAQNSQHALLAEGVAAAVLLSRLALLETQTGEHRRGLSLVEDRHPVSEIAQFAVVSMSLLIQQHRQSF